MSDNFGALDIPVPVRGDGESLGDPALDILADAIPTILEAYAGLAWAAAAPGEPLFRKVFTHDPRQEDFIEKDVPALYIYRQSDAPKEYTDAQVISETLLHVLWVEPTASQDKKTNREPFYNAFAKCIGNLVSLERFPAWVHSSDIADAAALAYGSNILTHCGFDDWRLKDVNRSTVEIPVDGGKARIWPAILARISVTESSNNDLVQRGYVPVAIDVSINTGGENPLVTGHIREPETP